MSREDKALLDGHLGWGYLGRLKPNARAAQKDSSVELLAAGRFRRGLDVIPESYVAVEVLRAAILARTASA